MRIVHHIDLSAHTKQQNPQSNKMKVRGRVVCVCKIIPQIGLNYKIVNYLYANIKFQNLLTTSSTQSCDSLTNEEMALKGGQHAGHSVCQFER